MEKKKGIDIKKCAYKVVIDSREKSINHILNSFDKGFENKPSHHDIYRAKNQLIQSLYNIMCKKKD
jgi:hypothetical protein